MRFGRVAVVTVFLFVVAGCAQSAPGPSGMSGVAPVDPLSLRVADPGPMTGYVRDCDHGSACVFGQPWKDTDGDGCDQRNQVLARDMLDVVRERCKVVSGTLVDPYTGVTLTRTRDVQIDHVVPLAEMWRSGAASWPLDRRVAAANDLDNLLAVQGKANQSKGDSRPEQWMPPRAEAHCDYARRYVLVKARYGLSVTLAERDRLTVALNTCGETK